MTSPDFDTHRYHSSQSAETKFWILEKLFWYELPFRLVLTYSLTADMLAADLPSLGHPLPILFLFTIPKGMKFPLYSMYGLSYRCTGTAVTENRFRKGYQFLEAVLQYFFPSTKLPHFASKALYLLNVVWIGLTYIAGFQLLDLYSTYKILSSSIMTSSFVWNLIPLLYPFHQVLISWE